uniref:B box-type domain-containing protein n=1 Tax=Macrostomum lignano TaxID=282301 RepID=A0A1I8FBY5_9PLAT
RPAELYCPQCEVAYCTDCLRRYTRASGRCPETPTFSDALDAPSAICRGQQQPPKPLPPSSSANGEKSRSRQSQRGVGAGGSLPLCPDIRQPDSTALRHLRRRRLHRLSPPSTTDSPESTSASICRDQPRRHRRQLADTPVHSLITLTAAAEARRAKCRQLWRESRRPSAGSRQRGDVDQTGKGPAQVDDCRGAPHSGAAESAGGAGFGGGLSGRSRVGRTRNTGLRRLKMRVEAAAAAGETAGCSVFSLAAIIRPGLSLATDAATDQTDLCTRCRALLAGLRQFDDPLLRQGELAGRLWRRSAVSPSRQSRVAAEAKQLPAEFNDRLRRTTLAELPAAPGTAGSIPESHPDTASTTHSNGGAALASRQLRRRCSRAKASTLGFSTAPCSAPTAQSLMGLQAAAQQQRLLLGDCGFGLIVTERCVAFIARGGELAQRPQCSSVSLRVCFPPVLPPHGPPAALAYEISAKQQQQQQDSSSSSSNASLSGVETAWHEVQQPVTLCCASPVEFECRCSSSQLPRWLLGELLLCGF